jgi:superfamily II DNA or RNA helicase
MTTRNKRANSNLPKDDTAGGFIDLKANGRIFPQWILHNFKKYKLPEIFRKENEDPCNVETKLELRMYQEFVGQYLGPRTPYSGILLYHGLGSGKTATAINLMNILYNYDHNYNFIVLIKASLRKDPWEEDLRVWLGKTGLESNTDNLNQNTALNAYESINFIHYDSPYADRNFMDTIKKLDVSKPMVYIIDEAHNFIRNVYSNINSKSGKRASTIYDYIYRNKREQPGTKVVLISATPVINIPFELSLLFNLLRPEIFPNSEAEFNRIFVTRSAYPELNPSKKNLFERRILGLVSYYVGATPDLYAKEITDYVTLPMSDFQYQTYRVFETLEEKIQQKAIRTGRKSKLYRTYTRQASNFIFPFVNGKINGELRPRPSYYKISDKIAEDYAKGKITESNPKLESLDLNVKQADQEREALNRYNEDLKTYIRETENYFINIHKQDVSDGYTIFDDLEVYKQGFDTSFNGKFIRFYLGYQGRRSRLLKSMYESSPKMTAIVFTTYVSPGKVMIYTNYVVMEGIDMLKVYFRLIGYDDYSVAKPYKGFCEYHGRVDPEDRVRTKDMFNTKENMYGERCKVILLSPSATEGIQLYDIRQEHILEPHWNWVRILQVIGRGIRQCSHKNLPIADRIVNVYIYKVSKPEIRQESDNMLQSTDEYIEDRAKANANLNASFLNAMKEAAVDCNLFRAHNMMSQSYQCFSFPESSIKTPYVGPAYKEDIRDDTKFDSGLHAANASVERIKVLKVMGVYKLDPYGDESDENYSKPYPYWYYPKNGMIYDYETNYPVGQVELINGLPNKLDKETYIISDRIRIPNVGTTSNP